MPSREKRAQRRRGSGVLPALVILTAFVAMAIAVLLFKKEIPSKYLNVINGIGFALLMALMLFVTFHDIVKLL